MAWLRVFKSTASRMFRKEKRGRYPLLLYGTLTAQLVAVVSKWECYLRQQYWVASPF